MHAGLARYCVPFLYEMTNDGEIITRDLFVVRGPKYQGPSHPVLLDVILQARQAGHMRFAGISQGQHHGEGSVGNLTFLSLKCNVRQLENKIVKHCCVMIKIN